MKFLSNNELASASTDSTLRLWDVKDNCPVSEIIRALLLLYYCLWRLYSIGIVPCLDVLFILEVIKVEIYTILNFSIAHGSNPELYVVLSFALGK